MKKLKYILSFLFFLILPTIATAQLFSDSIQMNCMDIKRRVAHGAALVDVRTKEEFKSGTLSGSINVPHDQVESNLHLLPVDKKKEIILYCKSGRRSELGKQSLAKLGYLSVVNAGNYMDLLKCWNLN